MYLPAAFKEENRDRLLDFIEQHSFGVLVSQLDNTPFATHLPFLVERNDSGPCALIGHMARANPQSTQAEGQTVLSIFSGPHAYVSPTWYEAPNTVPTWNYAAVHTTGPFKIVADPIEAEAIVAKTVHFYEANQASPWRFEPSDYYRKLLQSIVAFKIEIVTLEGKFKLSQNQSAERQSKVFAALRSSPDPNDTAVAALMKQRIEANKL